MATREQNYSSMETDIRLGADVNFRFKGVNPTLKSAVEHADVRATVLLIQHGADIHLLDRVALRHLCIPKFRSELAAHGVLVPDWALAYADEAGVRADESENGFHP